MKRNIIAGLIFLACTLSSTAFSQVPNQKDIDGAKKRCSTEHPGKSGQDITLRAMCLQSIDVYVLRQKQEAGDKSVASAIADLQGKLDEKFKAQNVELKALIQSTVASAMKSFGEVKPAENHQVKRDTAPVPNRDTTVSPPMPQKQAQMVPARTPYRIVNAPGNYAAATFHADMRFFIKFAFLKRGADEWLRNSVNARVVVLKNGIPLSIAHPGGTFTEFFADLDGDGVPEPNPYQGVNPSFSDDVYVGYFPGDDIRLVFLSETGRYIQRNGFSTVSIWGHAVRVSTFLPKQAGQWRILAFTGSID